MKTFSEKIGYDVKSFFNDMLDLIQNGNQDLVNYYTDNGFFPKEMFDRIDNLVARGKTICSRVVAVRNNFDSYFDFVVFDQIEDMFAILRVMENYSRWLKSSTVNGRYKTGSSVEYILKQNQTIESLASEVGYSDADEGGLDIALNNGIRETDYDHRGGLVFKFTYQNGERLSLESVVDEMTGENLLGKDLQRKIEIKDNDLVYLSPVGTFNQTCEILTGLCKNANPEFPEDGFDKSSITNKNMMNCRLATFIRQMYSVVRKDDTIAQFSIENVSMEQDSLRVDMKFISVLNNSQNSSAYGK